MFNSSIISFDGLSKCSIIILIICSFVIDCIDFTLSFLVFPIISSSFLIFLLSFNLCLSNNFLKTKSTFCLKYGFFSTKSSILKLTVSLCVNILPIISVFSFKYLSI